MFDQIWIALQEYFLNYAFGIVAVIFGIRAVSAFIDGRVSVLSIVLALVCGSIAVTMGQDIWKDFFELIRSAY